MTNAIMDMGVFEARTAYQVLQVPSDVPVWATICGFSPQMERWRRAYVSHTVQPLPRQQQNMPIEVFHHFL